MHKTLINIRRYWSVRAAQFRRFHVPLLCHVNVLGLILCNLDVALYCVIQFMGARRGSKEALAPPLDFEKKMTNAAVLQNTLKFSLAPLALAIITL